MSSVCSRLDPGHAFSRASHNEAMEKCMVALGELTLDLHVRIVLMRGQEQLSRPDSN